jgi:hypothetical protein
LLVVRVRIHGVLEMPRYKIFSHLVQLNHYLIFVSTVRLSGERSDVEIIVIG